jgi:hypothetical protein
MGKTTIKLLKLQKQTSATIARNKKEIDSGIDFIIKHFDPTILYFPRTIMTKKSNCQIVVYAKEEALHYFIESEFQDCRINAYRYSPSSFNSIEQWTPDLIFIDIDRSDFKSDRSCKLALSNTLKNIKEKLDGYPTVLFTGGGYHIYQPIEGIVFENYNGIFGEFSNDFDLFKEFLRFSKNNLSKGKADKNSNPSFKSCLLRIPGSINSKYGKKVTMVQKWNGYRPIVIEEFLEDFRTNLIQKKIDEHIHRQNIINRRKRNKNNYNDYSNYYQWIDKKILANPFPDCRKTIVDLILAPYLINIKKLSYEESYQIIRDWLDKCNSLQKLDNYRNFVEYRVSYALKNAASKPQIGPISLYKIKTDNRYSNNLYLLILQKGKG